MPDDWGGTKCHPAIKPFRDNLSPDDSEAFNECLMRLCRDPRSDGIHTFPFGSGDLAGYYLYRSDQFVILYSWETLAETYEPWRCRVRVLGVGTPDEVDRNPMTLWRWHRGGFADPKIL